MCRAEKQEVDIEIRSGRPVTSKHKSLPTCVFSFGVVVSKKTKKNMQGEMHIMSMSRNETAIHFLAHLARLPSPPRP